MKAASTDIPAQIEALPTYKARLDSNLRWALTEGSLFFEGKGAVQETLRRVTQRLNELGISYAVVGGMALYAHGFRRFTEDVNLLVSSESLRRIHEELEGLGYVQPFVGSKHLRDAKTKVKVEFLVSGQYPGDGKPKPVIFPLPETAAVLIDDIAYLNLPTLINLKLASGMSSSQRGKDLNDVSELIRTLVLPRTFSEQLSEFVREKFFALWDAMNPSTQRFYLLWRNKFLTTEAQSINDMALALRESAEQLERMIADGVKLETTDGVVDDYAKLVTNDPLIAEKYEMFPESDFMDI